ncbi:hypothetical protein LTR67_006801 [Exophiala xenobiotica]
MAPPKELSDELKFVMTCIKYSETELKPNFEEVAKETGAKSANACYHRLWGIKKKLGLTGSGNKKNAGTAIPSTGGRKRKAAPAKTKKESTDGDEYDVDEATPTKKRDTKKQAVVKDEDDGDSLEAEAGSVDTGDIGDLDSGDEEE